MHEVKIHLTVIKMARQVKTLAAKPDDLSSIPRAHRVEGENQSPPLSSDLRVHTVAHMSIFLVPDTKHKCK